MHDLTVKIRDEDWALLTEFGDRERREPNQQAEAFLDQRLAAERRAQTNGVDRPHSNGVTRRGRIAVAPA